VVLDRGARADRIPQHLLVIGGGYIGLELGFLYKSSAAR
jgi:pyruvate/2-oxoglutarate dehydrogenase complex dihydrolipoamide dehydrogenase (E3) component